MGAFKKYSTKSVHYSSFDGFFVKRQQENWRLLVTNRQLFVCSKENSNQLD
jgi:hypothetical protein